MTSSSDRADLSSLLGALSKTQADQLRWEHGTGSFSDPRTRYALIEGAQQKRGPAGPYSR